MTASMDGVLECDEADTLRETYLVRKAVWPGLTFGTQRFGFRLATQTVLSKTSVLYFSPSSRVSQGQQKIIGLFIYELLF